MKKNHLSRLISGLLAVAMILTLVPLTAFADYNPNYQSATHTVFKHSEQTLAPGVTQYTNYAYTTADDKQMVYYVTIADLNNESVVAQVAYKDMQCETYGMDKLVNMVSCANAKYSDPEDPDFISEYYTVVSATNGDGYNMTTGEPGGGFIMNGIVRKDWVKNSSNPAFLALMKDGTAVLGNTTEEYQAAKAAGIDSLIDAFGSILVWDGEISITQTSSYYSDRASRTMVGVTADGKLVCVVVDGRQEPFSCGASMLELAHIMKEAGCVRAFNLDGGGSTTYMAKNEGTNECVITNRPSDGSDRAISNGIIIASLAAPSDVFDRAALTPEDEYITVNATTTISAKGISPAGTAAEIPAEATYTLVDNTMGTINGDVFTPAKTGDAVIQMVYNNAVVGETTVHVVVPETIAFTLANLAAPYGQTAGITLTATYGEFGYEVKYDLADVEFELSDSKFGTVDGFNFNATADTTVTGSGTITVTLVGTDITATIPLTVGKGSEVIFDFEDADTSRWSGFDGYNAGIVTTCTPVTAENGMVHSGDYAMAYSMDFSQETYYEDYTYSLMCYNWDDIAAHGFTTDSDGIQQRGADEDYVDITGATGLGMWMYIPDEVDVRGLDIRYTIGGKKTATSAYERINSSMGTFFPYREGLGTEGWYYYYFDLSNYSNYAVLRLQNSRISNSINKNGKKSELYGDVMQIYVNDRAWKDEDKQFKSYTSRVTFFIDDITVDYSSVVADREAPVFGTINYAFEGASDALALNNGTTIAYSDVEFTASVAENTTKTNATGLNAATIKTYVDGNEVASTYKNGKITVDEITFADGVHTIKFEATDNAGNTSHVIRTFTINAETATDTIKVVPHDTTLTQTLVGSLYYIDIVATDISKVNSASVTLKVNNVNDWEPAGIEAADGFDVAYTGDVSDIGLITLDIVRTGDVSESGEAVLATIPVRTWYPHNALGKDSTWLITTKKCVYPMDTQVFTKAGSVEFTDGTTGLFSAATIQIDSEAMCEYGYVGVNKGNEGGTTTVTSWHEHNAVAVPDKPATCTEPGYTGRTYCEDCNSIVDFGTVVPATGHDYQVVEGVAKCVNCDELYTGVLDGLYYVDGALANGWVDETYYYVDGEAVTGLQVIDDLYYDFDENGVCQGKHTGIIFDEDAGVYRYVQIGQISTGWKDIEGDWYYFTNAYGMYTGHRSVGGVFFDFADDGHLLDGVWHETEEGTRYYYGPSYYRSGNRATVRFEEIDGYTYGFDKSGYRYEDIAIAHESNAANLAYEFDADGKYVGLYTGFYDGHYYVDGELAKNAGIIAYDDDYYYIGSKGQVFVGTVYVTEELTNDLVEAGKYTFDQDGKMIIPEPLSGIVDGYYYVNGAKYYAGMIVIDGDIYYVNSKGKVVTGSYYCTKTNDIKPQGRYEFDEDGKFILPEAINGIVDGYYYADGEKYYAGMIVIGNNIYYANSNGKIVTGSYYCTKTNDIMPHGRYQFDEDGKLILNVKNGIIDGKYYENDVVVKGAGVVEFNNTLYYINQQGRVFVGTVSVTAAKANGLIEPGKYTFDENGIVQ